ncbi:MAG: SDR family NAD(P)-dependent oxidoreductase [Aquabacterium sp.]|uniref:SDR family NAD(P)-dependent oxidoreductase n=1 Tax=Aquabacterium sp. TaxID=1872578 RepID=UPI00271A3F18|nr:SDR family NAD(P)-dependent oxidoreductase [Aquabacterium sp.]MDO9004326.1 SDR family NAD(P)-dependent oxidoreductase [Aquabacterium sp.]
MTQLAGAVVVVTGASEGIGRAIALEIARQGAIVVVMARSQDKLAMLVDEIKRMGGQADFVAADLGTPPAVRAAMAEAVRRHGPVDVLVNNVGAGTFKPLHLTSDAECDLALALPMVPAVVACQAVLPGMLHKKRGHIVNLTSPAGLMPMPYMAPYTAARHAMVALSRGLTGELEGTGIQVSLVCPSQVDTTYFLNNGADMRWYPPISKVFPVLTPERVAKEVVAAIRHDKREVVFPWQLRWAMRLYSVAPASSQVFMKACGLWHRGLGHPSGMS